MQGKIHRLIRGKGFGFILVEEQQYFFHHSEVREVEFRRLGNGDTVEFQVADGGTEGKNPRAVEVHLIAKAEPPPLPPASAAPAAPAAPTRPGRRPAARPARRRAAAPAEDNFGKDLFGNTDAAGELEFRSDVADSESFEPQRGLDGGGAMSTDGNAMGRPPSAGSRRAGAFRGGRGGGRPTGRGRGSPRPGRQREPRPARPKATGSPGERGEGVVRSLNSERGFGFIETATGDLFFHRSHVREDFGALNVGSRVAFVFGEGERGSQAQDVSLVS